LSTERLYLEDAHLLEFRARVLRVDHGRDAPSVVLDRSAFYPEGGGQLGDRGLLRHEGQDVDVVDTQVDEEGTVLHILATPARALPVGAVLDGAVDPDWRRDQRCQHTAQHMLSGAFWSVAGCDTVSARLGVESGTIDLDEPVEALERMEAVEEAVNRAILEDRPVRLLHPGAGDLEALGLRRPPKVLEGLRVIEVEGFDITPCGGTHCRRSSEVGLVRIVGSERRRDLLRVRFVAGWQAMEDYRRKDRALAGLAQQHTCGPLDVPTVVHKLQAETRELVHQLGKVRAELAAALADSVLAQHPLLGESGPYTPILLLREDDDLKTLQTLARRLSGRADVVALVCGRTSQDQDWRFSMRVGESADLHAGNWVRALVKEHGGRGGGNPDTAQGLLPGSLGADLLRTALAPKTQGGLGTS
jgi:alanyl-tRNA synthetase